ncbi:uroporphyrinogen-III C-methyltransferase [Chlorobium phaeovibrioides]|uniref:uroporphyrinogen-III C-methyltransferase n=2 Tax=Chlorobium phaeovibrioides TaxID=1094 RepID=A0ABW9UQI7_CHLPH|nr:uroporphyrinogen-III C-methyltransferase [Chlorobium phaeovibrioides]MWV54762.1 uroporphyrinogen-III C-methyltransferase [Chlorobium phaeovibrioides]RTY36757.1 uroporphyrinogen-III C-methyltransferase [Chlorobium phaeovibrioides]HCD35668.1 uroporphyrinogen-III C-methyltransferase [Chlorobium sp.]
MKKKSDTAKKGYVFIAGAGPGDPELLTLKAVRALQDADVILYDDLVTSAIIDQFGGLKIYTGKRKDSHHFEQDAINEEIARHALEGKTVVRLKGGDPFVFGRGGEEIDVLRKYGIDYEIIPGITAAHGASAYSEIPLTMRKVSSSVAFCTGHPVNKIQVPDADTLVYYMVASSVHEVLDAVVKKGRPEETKVAIVQNATRYNQRVWTGTLGELRRKERAAYSPALLIIGENINQFIENNWFSRKKKVLTGDADPRRYSSREWLVVNFPCRRVDEADRDRLEESISNVADYPVLFFPNRFAVKYFFTYLMEFNRDVRHLANCTICTLGRPAATELQKYGIIADLALEPDSPSDIAIRLKERAITGKKVLLPGSNLVDGYLMNELSALGNTVTPLSVYLHGQQEQEESIDLEFIDEIFFSSSTCVKNFSSLYRTIPAGITVTTADSDTEREYCRLFGKRT